MIKLICIGFSLFFLLTPGFSKDNEPSSMLFEVVGKSNQVFLLGSIHMLRKQDYPLPQVMDEAYDTAETLVMELDMDDLNPMELIGVFAGSATATNGQTLRSIMGRDAYAKAEKLAAPINANLTIFNAFEPWFAAMTIVNLQMNKLGFSENLGVEMHFVLRASKDKKEILGLETVEFQLSIFDSLPLPLQRELLLSSLEQAADLEGQTTAMIQAWKSGDTLQLNELLTDSMEETPKLYDQVVIQRNRNWIPEIESYLNDDDDYLVIVGAGHLVGKNSVVDLLRKKGHQVQQH